MLSFMMKVFLLGMASEAFSFGTRQLPPARAGVGLRSPSRALVRPRAFEADPGDAPPARSSKITLDRIDSMVKAAPIVLFMKGNPAFPQCGFSNTMVQILERLGMRYEAHDVLVDDLIRQGIKDYSQWPTIPQLYLCGEFIGGTDIVLEMFQSGELLESIEIALANEE